MKRNMTEITGGDSPHNIAKKQTPESNLLSGQSGREEKLAETIVKA